MAAAAARRAWQHLGSPMQAVYLAVESRLGIVSREFVNPDARLNVPVPVPSVLHQRETIEKYDWQSLQDRRPCVVYSYGLTPLKAWNYSAARGYYMRNISQLVAPANNKRAFLVDTLALVTPQFSLYIFKCFFHLFRLQEFFTLESKLLDQAFF